MYAENTEQHFLSEFLLKHLTHLVVYSTPQLKNVFAHLALAFHQLVLDELQRKIISHSVKGKGSNLHIEEENLTSQSQALKGQTEPTNVV